MTRYALPDKVVFITGGTGGIGSATARELLARGARVAIADLRADTADIARGMSATSAFGVVADVTDRESLDRAVAEVVDHFGRIDVAMANAGILARGATIRTLSPAAIDATFDVNVRGVLNTVAATMDQVIAQRGEFVFLSSVFAFMNGMGTIPYAMSKAAVEQLGRGLRVELAPHGVTSTTVYFSLIQTGMIKAGIDDAPDVIALLDTLPKPLMKRLQPHQAARSIVDGMARRAPRVMLPGRWKPIAALRGVLGPAFDTRLSKDPSTLAALARLDEKTPAVAPAAPVTAAAPITDRSAR